MDVDVKLEEDEREISQTIIWSDSINAWIDYPNSTLSGNTETGYHVGLQKEHSHVPPISPQTTSQGQILRIFPEMTGASDGENRAVKMVYFCKDQDTIGTSEGNSIKEQSWHLAPSSDILSLTGHASTSSGYLEAQINPTSQVSSQTQTQTNNELPSDNVNIPSHSTAIHSVLTSPATESGCHLAVSTRPILPEYCEPLNFPSDEEEDYNANLRQRLQCQKTLEDKCIRQCRGSYSRPNLRKFGKYWKDPYAKCKEIGVDFNVGSGGKQKLDLHFLTFGVMLEVSEYAKNINRARPHVIFDILDYNFGLGVQNEQQYDFSNKVEKKLKEMLKMHSKRTPEWLTEVFELPDPKTVKVLEYSLKWAQFYLQNSLSNPTPFDICIKEEPVVGLISPLHVTTESFSTKTDVTRCVDETAILGPENGRNDICARYEPDMGIVYPQYVQTKTFTTQTDRTMGQSLIMPTVEEALRDLYPICKEKGLDLVVKSKYGKTKKLDLHLLTRDVMFELADFASQVCGNWKQIVCDVLEHNFDLDLKSGKTELAEDIMGRLRAVLQRRTGKNGTWRWELENEAFFLKTSRKRKNPAEMSTNQKVTTASLEPKYQMKEVSKRRRLNLMRKNKDMDMLVTKETEGGLFFEVIQVEPHCVKIERISDETDLALCTDETKQIVVTNLDQSNVTSHTKEMVKAKACYPLCEEIGLDLDVTSKPSKKKLELNLLTNGVIFEVYKYAKIKSYHKKEKRFGYILFDILKYNFDLSLQNQRRNLFQLRINCKVKRMIQKHKPELSGKGEISKEVFIIPSVIKSQAKKTVLSDYFPEKNMEQDARLVYPHRGKDTIAMETVETISADEAATLGRHNGPADIYVKEESDLHSEVKRVYFCKDQDTVRTSGEHLIKDGSTPSNILTGNLFSLPQSPLPAAESGPFGSQIEPTSQI
ncbi:uncharacterized protein LOC129846222 [Salvelinus fontinalis]|uniref:uncharacterized protein LOC129846222 n=1 Tax=Salvelinus fontinalis TaxID=8038 RepID=UPI002485F40D|nr:uncharacterized protein LOC129846222 [Salvelinus fontinalis]XP_055770200.1 uncharacterized protein LOC129846222 [Salvelinus fontinalis]